MANLTPEEIREGRWQLGGPRILFWIALILMIIGAMGSIISFFTETFSFVAFWTEAGSLGALLGSIFGLIWALLWVILFWAELAAMSRGRPSAVGLGRFLLIIIMIFSFPIGTIIGAIVWRRFSHPAAQKYLNYI
ncbi:hypothetical protein ES705_00590 [subsurface metagenome]|nr:hypothetical protein [Clostridia bacterium]